MLQWWQLFAELLRRYAARCWNFLPSAERETVLWEDNFPRECLTHYLPRLRQAPRVPLNLAGAKDEAVVRSLGELAQSVQRTELGAQMRSMRLGRREVQSELLKLRDRQVNAWTGGRAQTPAEELQRLRLSLESGMETLSTEARRIARLHQYYSDLVMRTIWIVVDGFGSPEGLKPLPMGLQYRVVTDQRLCRMRTTVMDASSVVLLTPPAGLLVQWPTGLHGYYVLNAMNWEWGGGMEMASIEADSLSASAMGLESANT